MSTEKQKQIKGVIKTLNDLSEDITIPRNIKLQIQDIINTLKNKSDISIKISKALNELEEIVDDVNIEPYVRTQIWSIVSLLEKSA